MKIRVSEIPAEGIKVNCKEDLELDENGMVSNAELDLKVEKAGLNVFIRGKIVAPLKHTCSRCLKEFQKEVSLDMMLLYCPAEHIAGAKEQELAPDELNTGYYRDDEIDLGDMAKEQVLLVVPMKPLCSESCKGLCPKCGADLNEVACGCDLSQTDHRFKVLEKYLKMKKEK